MAKRQQGSVIMRLGNCAKVTTVTQMQTFGEFLLEQMNKREMTAREFARLVGVSNSVINKFLNHGINETYSGRPIGNPSIEFLENLARATNSDICYLIALVAPNAPRRQDMTIEAMRLSQLIGDLPEEKREMIDDFLVSLSKLNKKEL